LSPTHAGLRSAALLSIFSRLPGTVFPYSGFLDLDGISIVLISGFTDYQSGDNRIMSNTFQVQVVRRGVITLPKQLRDQNRIEKGDTLTLIDLGDGVVVMSPRRSRVDEIADKLAKEWRSSGESLESMLTTLREVRAEYGAKKRP
jgi:bifunctional DNA-binding transcriptional regulator/antitoxin component of YhaV-PrlF toxin-antitoxin module